LPVQRKLEQHFQFKIMKERRGKGSECQREHSDKVPAASALRQTDRYSNSVIRWTSRNSALQEINWCILPTP
jgi:hypothetical protein